MRCQNNLKKTSFTLTELMVTVMLSSIVALAIGSVLADGQKGYNKMYERIFW